MTRQQAVELMVKHPAKLGRSLGFTLLTDDLHNGWIVDMVTGEDDETLQAHRGSYKTTCVSLALVIIMVLFPSTTTLFLRKTDTDVKEIVEQVRKLLLSPTIRVLVWVIWGVELQLTVSNALEISTNLATGPKGTSQLVAQGIGGSLTGKHFDRIFTDDIVNPQDRTSKAERDHTKAVYQELQNIKNRGGRIFNTGTPWHIEDAFTLMPNPQRWDCYSTGLITKEELAGIREKMTASLFAANYELRHIASDDVLFFNPQTDGDPAMVEQGITHIDAAYGGDDYTALTICRKVGGVYYLYGRLWHRHVDDCKKSIKDLREQFNCGRGYCEDNGDKGYLARDLRREGENFLTYHESMNKHLKITTYLKGEWAKVVFVKGTDQEYINQICDYTEDAEHDDAPDSAASVIRLLWRG